MFNPNDIVINIPTAEELKMIYIVTIGIGLGLMLICTLLRFYFKKRRNPTKAATIIMASGLVVTLFQGLQLLNTIMYGFLYHGVISAIGGHVPGRPTLLHHQ